MILRLSCSEPAPGGRGRSGALRERATTSEEGRRRGAAKRGLAPSWRRVSKGPPRCALAVVVLSRVAEGGALLLPGGAEASSGGLRT